MDFQNRISNGGLKKQKQNKIDKNTFDCLCVKLEHVAVKACGEHLKRVELSVTEDAVVVLVGDVKNSTERSDAQRFELPERK